VEAKIKSKFGGYQRSIWQRFYLGRIIKSLRMNI